MLDLVSTVDITYPHVDLHPDRAAEYLQHPADCTNRYEPADLIEDPDVIWGTRRRTEPLRPQTHYAAQPTPEDALALDAAYIDHPHMSCVQNLMNHMEIATRYHSSTSLFVRTYTFDGTRWIYIGRVTTHIRIGGSVYRNAKSYDIPLADFERIAVPQATWAANTDDVVARKSDASVRYVAQALRDRGTKDRAFDWQPRREPDWAATSAYMPVDVSTLGVDDRTCNICYEMYTPADPPARLLCSDKHVSHYSCLKQWALDKAPEEVSCPHCRAKILGPPQLREARYGEDTNFIYDSTSALNQQGYSAFEHFERSCADLDECFADECEFPITVIPALFERVWRYFVEKAKEEPDSSTPRYNQVVRHPYFAVVTELMFEAVRETSFMDITTHIVYRTLLGDVNLLMSQAISNCPLMACLSQADQDKVEQKRGMEIEAMPYRMTWTVEMMLSRTLRFINEREHGYYNKDCKFWYEHGDRAYYDAEPWEDFFGFPSTTAMMFEN